MQGPESYERIKQHSSMTYNVIDSIIQSVCLTKGFYFIQYPFSACCLFCYHTPNYICFTRQPGKTLLTKQSNIKTHINAACIAGLLHNIIFNGYKFFVHILLDSPFISQTSTLIL